MGQNLTGQMATLAGLLAGRAQPATVTPQPTVSQPPPSLPPQVPGSFFHGSSSAVLPPPQMVSYPAGPSASLQPPMAPTMPMGPPPALPFVPSMAPSYSLLPSQAYPAQLPPSAAYPHPAPYEYHQPMYSAQLPPRPPQQRLTGSVRRQPDSPFEETGRAILSKYGLEPFADYIVNEPTPPMFQMPKLPSYTGESDPGEHICHFQDALTIHTISDAFRCRLFLMSLASEARLWFASLSPQFIYCFDQFVSEFMAHFSSSRKPRRSTDVLHAIRQGPKESLRDYISRFRATYKTVTDLEPAVAKSALKMGLQMSPFRHSLSVEPASSVDEVFRRAWRYINAEEEDEASRCVLRAVSGDSASPSTAPRGSDSKRSSEASKDKRPSRREERSSARRDSSRQSRRSDEGSDLRYRVPMKTIVAAIQHKDYYKKPAPLKSNPAGRDNKKYCHYHEDHGHDTEDCRSLRYFLAQLVRDGHLKDFLVKMKGKAARARSPSPPRAAKLPPLAIQGDLNVISGGGGPAASHRSSLRSITQFVAAASVEEPTPPISFEDADLPSTPNPFHDAVVIQVVINYRNVHRVLIDTGSSANVLFLHTLERLNVDPRNIRATQGELVGFAGERRVPEGIVTLPIAMRDTSDPGNYALRQQDLIILRAHSAYNVILGRPFLNEFRAVPSTRHFCVKFPTLLGVATVRGDHVVSRQVYLNSIRDGSFELLLPAHQDKKAPRPVEGTEAVAIPGDALGRSITIAGSLQGNFRTTLVNFLFANIDIFAWSPSEMPGVDLQVACHRLHLDPQVRPVKQRKRKSADQWQMEIKEELRKLLDAKFIREIQYPSWVSNVVMVPKANGSCRMCVDYTTLNQYCPKDCYPLPSIDALVDSVEGYPVLSFLDAFSGFHQIKMHPADQEATAFITNEGTYCYNVMPFGLKNAGATYQRLMDNVFRAQKGRNMEVYIDDVLVKSRSIFDHIRDLEETFANLRKFNMKLNPTKCTFGASSGKFLGFMVGPNGIEPNPDKIKAIINMEAPKDLSSARKLAGRVAALSRFISRSAEKCAPLFNSLKKADKFSWSEECQSSFDLLKRYLTSAPVMSSPKPGDELYIYLGASSTAVSSVLLREDGTVQQPIYYVSRSLNGAERNYSVTEKLILGLVITVRKLKPYFQSHLVSVVTDRPLRHIIQKPDVSGRLAKWAIELSGFEIQFVPRTAIKAQALADFIADFSAAQPGDSEEAAELIDPWTLFTDGASGSAVSGVGVVLKSPEGLVLHSTVRLLFHPTNNQAEYEALLAGLQLANAVGVQHLEAFADSLLVVNQVSKVFECRDVALAKYLDLVRAEIAKLSQFRISHIPREENQLADTLSRAEGPCAALIRDLRHPSIDDSASVVAMDVDTPPCWMTPIIDYLQSGTLPSSKLEARAVKSKAARYFLWEGFLYRKSFSGISLKCVHPLQVQDVLEDVHSGECGSHAGGRTLAHRIMKQGYFWPSLMQDAKLYAQRCQACQFYGSSLHQQSQPLQPILSPWPFAVWGMDFVGPFPTGSGQRKHLLVLIDYFTKWVEAVALTSATTAAVIKFLARDIFCRFGVPLFIITDNGTQFTSDSLRSFCNQHGVTLKFASVAHPQSNGQAEAANKRILTILKKRLMGRKGLWADELPAVLWSYRTTPSTSTGETPFALAFGMEAMTPTELLVPSARVKQAMLMEKDQPQDWIDLNGQLQQLNLDQAEELRLAALSRMSLQKQLAVRYTNKVSQHRQFQQGDLVLRKVSVAGNMAGTSKLSATWDGPFIVSKPTGSGAYHLQTSEGEALPRTWNGSDLKAFLP